MNKNLTLIITLLSLIPGIGKAQGVGTTAGSTLLQAPGARAAALGEAFSATQDDITAFNYNPAALGSLAKGQASFLYQNGIVDDAYSQFMIGAPTKNMAWGASFGYYNGGTIELFDGSTSRSVTAKKDLSAALGIAAKFSSISIGLSGKYLSSELGELVKSNAFAGDVGIQHTANSRLNLGASVQNFGTKISYLQEKEALPMTARVGAAILAFKAPHRTMLMLDAPYRLQEKKLNPAIGLETRVGLLSLRAGYKTGRSLEGISFGTGVELGNSFLDYSVGLVDKLDTRHRISFSMKFGGLAPAPMVMTTPVRIPRNVVTPPQQSEIVVIQEPEKKEPVQPVIKKTKSVQKQAVYLVKPGDTLESIALKIYGDRRQWTKIYDANERIINNPKVVDLVGVKLRIP